MRKVMLVGALVLATSTSNAEVTPAESEKQANSAIQYRQALLQLVRSNVGALGAMAKGQIPTDDAVIARNAERIEQLSNMMEDYFAVDTSQFDMETAADKKIWKEFNLFSAKIDDLNQAAMTLKQAAQNQQQDQYKQAIGAVFKSCKGCHDSYKLD